MQMKKNMIIFVGLLVSIVLFQNFSVLSDFSSPGVENTVNVARGQKMGSCLFQLDQNFNNPVNVADKDLSASAIWPVTSCQGQQQVTCASGFMPVAETPVQMNCASNPSLDLVNCYWVQHRCISTTGSMQSSDFIRGEEYGNCLVELDENFRVQLAHATEPWPMTRCDSSGVYECAAGFTPVASTPVQMNCSSSPSKSNTKNCYWLSVRCVKN
jgi:hypothetical protein